MRRPCSNWPRFSQAAERGALRSQICGNCYGRRSTNDNSREIPWIELSGRKTGKRPARSRIFGFLWGGDHADVDCRGETRPAHRWAMRAPQHPQPRVRFWYTRRRCIFFFHVLPEKRSTGPDLASAKGDCPASPVVIDRNPISSSPRATLESSELYRAQVLKSRQVGLQTAGRPRVACTAMRRRRPFRRYLFPAGPGMEISICGCKKAQMFWRIRCANAPRNAGARWNLETSKRSRIQRRGIERSSPR